MMPVCLAMFWVTYYSLFGQPAPKPPRASYTSTPDHLENMSDFLLALTLVGSQAEYRLRVSVTSSARLQTALHADPFISGENPLYRRIALEKRRKPI